MTHPSLPLPAASARTRSAAVLAALCLVAFLTGCSTFNRDWKAATAQPSSVNGIEGPWEGVWISEVSGHRNQLRCLMNHQTNRTYLARFQAKYRKLITLTFSYEVHFEVTPDPSGGPHRFHGKEDLGKLAGGVYEYEGQASPTNFFSTYSCEVDKGTFLMHRPEGRP